METRTSIVFPPFQLDLNSEQLWRADQAIALRPKTFAVLRYLVEHAGQLVTKDELLDTVWAGTIVSDTVLKSCIRELREALGDDAQTPQYIATVHRRGYRWVASLSTPPPPSQKSKVESQKSSPAPSTQHPVPFLVGRESEFAQLRDWLEKALHGERQLVFVTGEAGIGKTTLVDAFLQTLDARRPTLDGGLWLGRGQCIEQYGAGEPYMPILEALGRLCREPSGERLIALLHQYAPTWLVQMPTLLETVEWETLQRKVQGATRERMLREMAEAIDVITAEQPLILWLEDLHWSDVSTLELLSLLDRRREPARLLIIGTYRPVDVIVNEHPLRAMKQELQLHRQCEELAVRLLTEEAVEKYLVVRVPVVTPDRAPLQPLAHTIHQRTEGNPLFMVNVVDELLAQEKLDGAAVAVSTPTNIQQMIEQHLERLSAAEQRLLEVASVAGMEFSAAAVAAGTEAAVDEVEQQCTVLARRGQFLQAKGTAEWPDGTVATRYGFLHALYQEVTYERLPTGRRARLHQCIGEQLETACGKQVGEVAAELAVHFERGRDYQRAVQYLQQAGQNAIRRSAHQEAITLLTKGLELLKALPDTPERIRQELTLQITLRTPLAMTKGFTDLEVKQVSTRAFELGRQLGESSQLFPAQVGLWTFYFMRAELQTARELGEQLLHLAQDMPDPFFLLSAHYALGATSLWLGELISAREHFAQGIALYDSLQDGSRTFLVANPGVTCRAETALALWSLGYPDRARKRTQEALTLARELAHPYSLVDALDTASILYQLCREEQAVEEYAEEQMTLAIEHGFPLPRAWGTILRGWALAERGQQEEGIVQMHQGLAAAQTSGMELERPHYLALLAEAYGQVGQTKDGLAQLAEALTLVCSTGEHFYKAELYRLKGELTLQKFQVSGSKFQVPNPKTRNQKRETRNQSPSSDPHAEAEACFLKAIEVARRQSARSLELRASTSLARLWQSQGKRKEAHKLLSEIYNWFTEGFDTRDLQEAKALLIELS